MSELPRRNLPELSEQWGRDAEARVARAVSDLRGTKGWIVGANRSDAATTADLARRVQVLQDAAEDLEDFALQIPVIEHKLARKSNFSLDDSWTDTAKVNMTIPEGKSEAQLTVVGLGRLYNRDDSSGGGGGGGGIPPAFTAVSNDGTMIVNMTQTMLNYAATVYNIGRGLSGVGRRGVVIALMTVFVESVWLMYANSNVPDSLNYPHDAVGSDHDSLGLFQQRPSAGWGSVAELMDVEYNARAFYGGSTGPNYPSPAGLLDIPGWESMGYGEAAQAVQVSAFPERYDNWRNASESLYDAIAAAGGGSMPLRWPFVPEPAPEGDMPPVGSADEPRAEYGPRALTGAFHEGMDFGYRNATAGSPIVSAGAGTVHTNQAGFMGYGTTIIIDHGTDSSGNTIYTLYAHRVSVEGPSVGSPVAQGQVIGHVGSTGDVTGPHLHFEVHVVPPGGSLTWDYQNPSYDSNRTTVNPRDYIDGGGPGPGPDPDPGAVHRVQVRIGINGSYSAPFAAIPSRNYAYSYPSGSDVVEAPEGTSIPVTIQARVETSGGSTTRKAGTDVFFTVIGSYT